MSEIDWSNAPEEATHYLMEQEKPNREYWIKQTLGMFYFCRLGYEAYGFRPWVCDFQRFLPSMVARPAKAQAWSGEGLPPVGVVCEYNLKAGPWFKCEIRYVLDKDQDPEADGWQAVIWCPHLEKEQMAKASSFNFRPIRTPEQIAADERNKACDRMYGVILDNVPEDRRKNGSDIVEALYDAGLRFTEQDQ